MRYSLCCFIALLGGFVLTPGARAAEPCKLGLLADLHVAFGPAGAVLLPVTVNGSDAWMVLSLSAGLSSVFPRTVEALSLSTRKLKQDPSTGSRVYKDSEVIKSGRTPMNQYVKFDSMRLGSIGLDGFEAIVAADGPQALPLVQGRPVIGRIGSGLFKTFDTELDLGHDAVRIFRANTCDSPPVYWAAAYTAVPMKFDVAGTLTFAMDLDGHKIRTALATDTGRSMLEQRTTSRFFGFAPDAPELERVMLPNGERAMFRAMSLTAEGVKVSNARVQLYDRPDTLCKLGRARDGAIAYDNCFNTTPFALGTDLLKRLRLLVGSKREEIYVTAAGP